MADEFENFQTPLSPFRLQSQIGKETQRRYKEGENVVRIFMARVTKVNYKYNTVDVRTIKYKDSTTRNPSDEGRFSAKLPVAFGGRTPEGNVYGSNTLVTVGSLVLLGFLDGNKDNPIVLNIYNDADNHSQLTRTTYTGGDESDEELQQELWHLFSLYPSMTYNSIDGNGNREVTFSGKSFLLITDSDPENAYVQDGGFDYQDLPNSRYANGEPIEPKSPQSPTLLYVHQGIYDNHRVTFFVKSDGTVRVSTRHLDGDGVTFYEMTTGGKFSLVQKKGDVNPEAVGDSERFSEFSLSENGDFLLQSDEHKLEVTKDEGVLVDGEPITALGGGDVDLSDIEEKIENQDVKITDMNTSIETINGKIEMKADAKSIDELRDTISEYESSLEVAFNKIEANVSKEEHKKDLDDVRDYADNLLKNSDSDFKELKGSIKDLRDYINGSFSDGIVEGAQAKAIEKYLNALDSDKSDLDSTYKNLYDNYHLPKESKKELGKKKDKYDDNYNTLVQTINKAIEDGRVTDKEKTDVDVAFKDYNDSVSDLRDGVQTAIDDIMQDKADEAKDEAIEYTNSQYKILDDRIQTKVAGAELTTEIEKQDSKRAEIEKRVTEAEQDIEETKENVPYKAEIVSTQGVVFKNGNIETTLFCKVYRGSKEITDSLSASQFVWTRVSNDEEEDRKWNLNYGNGKKSIKITNTDVHKRATFNCEIKEKAS